MLLFFVIAASSACVIKYRSSCGNQVIVSFKFWQEYERALKYSDAILQVEPRNHQAKEMKEYIKKKMKKGMESVYLILLPMFPASSALSGIRI